MLRRVTSYRANKILFNFLKSNHLTGTVILPANICPDVVETLRYAGNPLHFVDIDVHTLCLDWQQVQSVVQDAAAVLAVHTYGMEDDFNEQFETLRAINPKIAIIDDRCLCMPELDEPNSIGDLVIYSMCSKKQVDLGAGGIGYVADCWNYEEILVPENDVLTNETWTLDKKTLPAKMDAVIKHKEKLNAIYRKNLPAAIQLPAPYQHWRFNIIVPNKEEILKALFEAGLFASGHYNPQSDGCNVAINLYTHVINLFNDFYYTEEQAIKTCEIIQKLITENRMLTTV